MLTQIIIQHADVRTLKESIIWQQAMELFLADGELSVTTIAEVKPDADDEPAEDK